MLSFPTQTAPRETSTAPAMTAPTRNRSEQILASLPQPMIVLRPDRHLVFANLSAERLFASAHARQTAQRLMSVGHLGTHLIDELLRLAAGGHTAQAGLWFSPGMNTGWLNITRPAPGIARFADWPSDGLLVLVHMDQPDLTQTARIDALCQRCNLTHTERYVLMLLADGLPVKAIARQLDLQVSTVRSHVRNLLSKTQAPSMMQLMRWLGSADRLPE